MPRKLDPGSIALSGLWLLLPPPVFPASDPLHFLTFARNRRFPNLYVATPSRHPVRAQMSSSKSFSLWKVISLRTGTLPVLFTLYILLSPEQCSAHSRCSINNNLFIEWHRSSSFLLVCLDSAFSITNVSHSYIFCQ